MALHPDSAAGSMLLGTCGLQTRVLRIQTTGAHTRTRTPTSPSRVMTERVFSTFPVSDIGGDSLDYAMFTLLLM